MTRPLPIVFGQTDYLQQLGTTGGTIHDYGCYLTSFANLAKACGKDTDPIALNKAFIDQKVYVNGNLLPDDALTKIFPDIVYQKSYEFPNEVKDASGNVVSPAVPADLNLLCELLKDPSTWVLIKLNVPAPFYTHFVLCAGINGVVSIADPMTKHIDDFSSKYGDPSTNIIKFVVYKGTPVNTTGDGLNYEQLFNDKRVECDANWNMGTEVISYLGIEITPNDKEGMAKRAKDKIDNYLAQIGQYKKAAEDAQTKYESAQHDILDLKGEIAEIHTTDKNYGQQALDAQHLAKDREDFLHMISDEVGVQYDPSNDKKLVDEVLQQISLLRNQQTSNPQQGQLQTIVSHFVSLGINNYLTGRGIAPIDPGKLDPQLEQKIQMYLSDLANELLTLHANTADPADAGSSATNEAADPVIASLQKPKPFFSKIIQSLLGLFFSQG